MRALIGLLLLTGCPGTIVSNDGGDGADAGGGGIGGGIGGGAGGGAGGSGGAADAGNDTCTPCLAGACTRACLPSLGAAGPATPPAYSDGGCPTLVRSGWNRAFGSNLRDFRLHVPSSTVGPYGVLFMWHGAGGDALSFEGTFTPSFDAHGYVLVVPDGQGKYDSEWQVEPLDAQEDLIFFDEVLRCVSEQLPIDRRRVHSMGFSVGARFSDYLLGRRSNRVASVVTWSGGDRTPQGLVVVPVPPHAIPTLMYHGGATDTPACCGEAATLALVNRLKPNGNFMVVCNHNGGHSYPPQPGRVADLWRFIEAHPFMPGNEAAWRNNLPADLPAFCAVP